MKLFEKGMPSLFKKIFNNRQNIEQDPISVNIDRMNDQTVTSTMHTPQNINPNANVPSYSENDRYNTSSNSTSSKGTDIDRTRKQNGPPGGYPPQQQAYYSAPMGNPPAYQPYYNAPPQGGYAQYQQGQGQQQQPVVIVVQQQPPPEQRMDRRSSLSLFVFDKRFEDPRDRRRFIQRTYMILTLDLLFMFGLTFLFSFYPGLKEYLEENRSHFALIFWPFWTLAVFACVMHCCCIQLFTQPGWKWLMHVITVVGYGGLAATIAVCYEREVVLLAVGGTFAIVASITLIAFITPVDFTKCYFIVALIVLLLVIAGISAGIFLPNDVIKPAKIGIAIAFVAVFSIWFLIDTQSLMAGKSVSISPDQHVWAATELFLDIYIIFVCLLRVLGYAKD